MNEPLTDEELDMLDQASWFGSTNPKNLHTRAVTEIRKLREALEEYGEHKRDCMLARVDAYDPKRGFKVSGKWQTEKPHCNCGLSDALAGEDDKQ